MKSQKKAPDIDPLDLSNWFRALMIWFKYINQMYLKQLVVLN